MSKEKGWIKLYRDIFDSEIMEKPPHFREVWLFLLLRANHKVGFVSGTQIERGQTITSYKEIIQALSWKGGTEPFEYTYNEIHSALRYLKRSGMIVKRQSGKKILVTIVNYRDYQQDEKETVHDESMNSSQSVHDKSTISPRTVEPLNKKKEVRSKKERENPTLSEIEKLFEKVSKELSIEFKTGAPERFYDNFEAKGWKINGNKIEDVEARIRSWVKDDFEKKSKNDVKKVYAAPPQYRSSKSNDNENNNSTKTS